MDSYEKFVSVSRRAISDHTDEDERARLNLGRQGEALSIEKYRDAVARLDDDERGSLVVDTLGGNQEMTALNESGLS